MEKISNEKATNYLTDLKVSEETQEQIFKRQIIPEQVNVSYFTFNQDLSLVWNAQNVVPEYQYFNANILLTGDATFDLAVSQIRGRAVKQIDVEIVAFATTGPNVPAAVTQHRLYSLTVPQPILIPVPLGIDLNRSVINLASGSWNMNVQLELDRSAAVVATDVTVYTVWFAFKIQYY